MCSKGLSWCTHSHPLTGSWQATMYVALVFKHWRQSRCCPGSWNPFLESPVTCSPFLVATKHHTASWGRWWAAQLVLSLVCTITLISLVTSNRPSSLHTFALAYRFALAIFSWRQHWRNASASHHQKDPVSWPLWMAGKQLEKPWRLVPLDGSWNIWVLVAPVFWLFPWVGWPLFLLWEIGWVSQTAHSMKHHNGERPSLRPGPRVVEVKFHSWLPRWVLALW